MLVLPVCGAGGVRTFMWPSSARMVEGLAVPPLHTHETGITVRHDMKRAFGDQCVHVGAEVGGATAKGA